MTRVAWLVLLLALAWPSGAAADGLDNARAEYFKALATAKKERRSAVDKTLFHRVVGAAHRANTAKAQRLLAEIAKHSVHPYQRQFTIMMLSQMPIAQGEDESTFALRMAKVCVPLSRKIKATAFVTPDWTVEDVDAANALMERSLRTKLTELMREGARPIPWLDTLGKHRSEVVRRSVARAVLDVMPKDIHGWLRKRVKRENEPSVHVLWTKAAALYGLDDLASHLVRRADSEDVRVRAASVRALRMLTPDKPAVRTTLLRGFGAKAPILQSLAAWEAGRAGRDAFVGRLGEQLRGPHWEVSTQALKSLESIASAPALSKLVKALPDLRRDVAIRAQRALERMTGQSITEPRDWWRWWVGNQTFDPSKSRVAPPPEETSERVERFAPEGRRFVVAAFLDIRVTETTQGETNGRAALFKELCEGLDDDAAMALWCNGWWAVEGDTVRWALFPEAEPKLQRPRYPGGRRPSAIKPPPARVIPYFDATRQALRTAQTELAKIFAKAPKELPKDRPWRDLEEVFSTAEVESIYIFATRDLPVLPAAQTDALLARLRWAALGRPLRMRLAYVGKEPPTQLVRLMEMFHGSWAVRVPVEPPPPKKEDKQDKGEKGKPDGKEPGK